MKTKLTTTAQTILDYIGAHPKCSRREISEKCKIAKDNVKNNIKTLMLKGYIKVYPTDKRPEVYVAIQYNEYVRAGEANITTATEVKANTDITKPYGKTLEDYTPRELMVELKRRGYSGKLKLVVYKEADFAKL